MTKRRDREGAFPSPPAATDEQQDDDVESVYLEAAGLLRRMDELGLSQAAAHLSMSLETLASSYPALRSRSPVPLGFPS